MIGGGAMTGRGSLIRLLLLALIWGSSFLWIKLALHGLSPVQLVLVRLAMGAAVLLLYCRARRIQLPRGVRRWMHLAAAAVVANSVPYLLFAVGEQSVDSSLAGTLNATTPLWTVALALATRQDRRLGAARGAGLLIGFGGALLVMAPWQAGGAAWGALACLAAAGCYGISYIYTGRYLVGWGHDPIAMVAAQLVAATVLLLAVLPFAGTQPVQLRADALVGVVVLGALGTGVAYALNYRLVVDDGPTAASAVTYLLPVTSVLLGAVFLGEALRWHVAVGLVLALLGVAATRRDAPAHPRGRRSQMPRRRTAPAPVAANRT
jgi:drug/metabolite transporter (DMT)-like permease